MSQLAVEGFRAEREAILTVAKDMTAEEWLLPSACAGWTVRDVMGHMACTLHGVIDPAFLPDTTSGTERAMEPAVAERRTWPIEAVIDEYETYSEQAANVFASVQDAPLSETMLAMGELGTHPMSILPSTFLFDGYTHLRNDILTPNGSIDRPQPPRDEMRLRPTIEWMIAGLPWMCADALAGVVDRPLVLRLEGPGGGTWTIAPGGDEGRVVVSEKASVDAAATVHGTDHDFVIWGTRRAPWRDLVKVEGDDAYAARVLDAIKII
ncbi:MAG: maleylpyruvate isomerase family mycothiol-dependent enzyme [Actinomycetota bacterium]|nr:maleylpyruvate isomerase family mycothiol-dependent enzyme [Actinomycetota bacterium]